MAMRRTGLVIKRAMDVIGSGLLLTICLPLIAIISLSILVTMGRPVIFRQDRPFNLEENFKILKFRTMSNARNDSGILISDGQRITRLGSVLRRSSLDELPELWNVLRGEMSLVGPRPLLPRYTPYMREDELLRFSMRPGITGLAQVNGRNSASWDARLAWDAEYVRQWSLRLDVHILRRTLTTVLSRSGLVVDPMSEMKDLDEERKDSI